MDIDNGFKSEGQPMRRFYLNRIKDETGISRTGRVLEGVLTQSGVVFTQWRPPHSTMGIYNSLEEFKLIHVDCHPSCNEIVWIDLDGLPTEMDETTGQRFKIMPDGGYVLDLSAETVRAMEEIGLNPRQ